jgi:hypothetical protein
LLENNIDYDNDNNASYVFIEDSISKKQTARKSIITKADRLPTLAQVKKKSGRVFMSNLYDQVMPYDEFKSLDNDAKTKVLVAYRNKYSIKEIAEQWHKPMQNVSDFTFRLGIKKDKNGVYACVKKTAKAKSAQSMKSKFQSNAKPSLQEVVNLVEKRKQLQELENLPNHILQEKPTIRGANDIKTDNEQKPVTTKEVKPTKPNYESYHHIPNKILTGENIANFILKLVDLFDSANDIKIMLTLTKVSLSNFTFEVKVDDTFAVQSFSDEILEVIAVIPKEQIFALTADIKEIKNANPLPQINPEPQKSAELTIQEDDKKHEDIQNDIAQKLAGLTSN